MFWPSLLPLITRSGAPSGPGLSRRAERRRRGSRQPPCRRSRSWWCRGGRGAPGGGLVAGAALVLRRRRDHHRGVGPGSKRLDQGIDAVRADAVVVGDENHQRIGALGAGIAMAEGGDRHDAQQRRSGGSEQSNTGRRATAVQRLMASVPLRVRSRHRRVVATLDQQSVPIVAGRTVAGTRDSTATRGVGRSVGWAGERPLPSGRIRPTGTGAADPPLHRSLGLTDDEFGPSSSCWVVSRTTSSWRCTR